MKLGVFSVVLGAMPFGKAMQWLKEHGVQSVELGCGGAPGKAHCDPEALLSSERALDDFLSVLRHTGLEIAALSCHGNPVHPDPAVAKASHDDFVNAVLLAEKLGVKRVVGFSGCPGGSPVDATPNWVTCAWPEDYPTALDYQWNEVLIPYWRNMAGFAAAHGVEQLALEMHPGFCVYNPETLLKLRKAVGPMIGANFDPSHLFWQGIDPVAAIRALGGAIHFFHAKDTALDTLNSAVNGVLDTTPFADLTRRSWRFCTVGYGHGHSVWNGIIAALRLAGYDGVLSIEHEDALMSPTEGLGKAIAFMKQTLMFESV